MAREIAEQPAAIADTLDALLPQRAELQRIAAGRRHVMLVARGSSSNAAVYARYLLEIHTGRGVGVAAPSLVTHYAVERDLSDTVAICLSQSGETEEIVQAEAWAAACGARTVAITNNGDSALAAGADLVLVTQAGPEYAVPATKSYMAQLTAIAIVADALAASPRTLEADLRRAPDEVATTIETRAGVDAAVNVLAATKQTLVAGRGLVYGTALEMALKLEETCLEPVRGLSYADLRHGPIAVVDDQVAAVLVAAADGPMVQGMVELAHDLDGLDAATIGIGGPAAFQEACEVHVPGPDLPETVAPLGLVVPGQLIVEALARHRGLDPDAPRSLSKVTQTDVLR